MSQPEHDADAEVIAPGDKSGFEPADVLEKAEIDDEVYIEFEVEGREGTYGVRALVANTSETEQDDGKKLVKYYLEAPADPNVRTLTAKLLSDIGSAYNSILDSVDIEWTDDQTPTAHIYDVTHVEVEKA